MLNTDLHDPRLKSGAQSRKPMTKEVFIKNLRTADNASNLDESLLASIFDSVLLYPIEWQEDKQKEKEKIRRKKIAASIRNGSQDPSSVGKNDKLELSEISFCRVPPPPPSASEGNESLEFAVKNINHKPSIFIEATHPINSPCIQFVYIFSKHRYESSSGIACQRTF